MTTTVEDAVKLADERIDAWVAELRNPNRRQGVGALKTANGAQCCLGVLCDIAGLESQWSSNGYLYKGPVTNDPVFKTHPPRCVANSVGIKPSGELEGGWEGVPEETWEEAPEEAEYRNLVHLNDTAKWSFEQIADLIETNKSRMIERVRYHAERKLGK